MDSVRRRQPTVPASPIVSRRPAMPVTPRSGATPTARQKLVRFVPAAAPQVTPVTPQGRHRETRFGGLRGRGRLGPLLLRGRRRAPVEPRELPVELMTTTAAPSLFVPFPNSIHHRLQHIVCLHLRFLTVVMDRSYDISIGAARVRRVRRRVEPRCASRCPAGIGTRTVWHTDISIGICTVSRVSPRQNVEVRGLC